MKAERTLVKLLFSDLFYNVSLSRLPSQFKKLGAETFGLGYRERILLKSDSFAQKYRFPNAPTEISFKNTVDGLTYACNHSKPEYLLTNDETLIRGLLKYRSLLRNSQNSLSDENKALLSLLEASLAPNTKSYNRDVSVQYAGDAGFNIPEYTTAHNLDQLERSISTRKLPLFIKLNFAAGGTGVYPVVNGTDIPSTIKKIANSGYTLSEDNPAIVQSMAKGNELTVSFAAWKGELLGYIVARPLETLFENGPSTVVENLYRPNWAEPLAALVKKLQFTGFGGVDMFEISEKTLPTVIEVNLRSTHTVPSSSILGNDLVSLFYNRLNGGQEKVTEVQHNSHEKIIAIFPEEVMRDKNSPYLKSIPLDICWEDKGLLHALTNAIYNYKIKSG